MNFNRSQFFKLYRSKFARGLNMFPSASGFNVTDSATGNTVFNGYYVLFSIVCANFQNILFGNFCVRSFTVCVPFVINHICRVIDFLTRTQVRGVYAGRIIADKMSNYLIGNVFAGFKLKNKTVRHLHFTVIKNPTVSKFVSAASPKPAIIGFFNSRIKSLSNRSFNFVLLVARIRAVFCAFVFWLERLSAKQTRINSVNFLCNEFAFIRTKNAFRSAKRKEVFAALLTSLFLVYSFINHSAFSPIKSGLARLVRDVQNLVRAVSILPRNIFNPNKMEVFS